MRNQNKNNKLLYDPSPQKRRDSFLNGPDYSRAHNEIEEDNIEEDNLQNQEQVNTNDQTEHEEKQEKLKQVSQPIVKEQISKVKKTVIKKLVMSPQGLAIIGMIVFFVFIMLVILVALGGTVKAGGDFAQYESSKGYWWPIGVVENSDKVPQSTLISSKFGCRPDPFKSTLSYTVEEKEYIREYYTVEECRKDTELSFHNGLDITTQTFPTVITASKGGQVIVAENSDATTGFGTHVIIDHGNNEHTVYGHMKYDSLMVDEYEIVNRGEPLGIMGTTGSSTGVHLHFEFRINGKRVDPEFYVSPQNPYPTDLLEVEDEVIE